MIRKYFILLLMGMVFVSCGKQLYKYNDYDDAVYTYISGEKKSDIKNISKSYQTIVGEKEMKKKSSKFNPYTIPPGACADYAYLLYQQNDTVGANKWFEMEINLYPESKTYINNLKQELGL